MKEFMNRARFKYILIFCLGILLTAGIILLLTREIGSSVFDFILQNNHPSEIVENNETGESLLKVAEFSTQYPISSEDDPSLGILTYTAHVSQDTSLILGSNKDTVLLKNDQYTLIIEQVNESFSELIPSVPEFVLLDGIYMGNTIYRVENTSIYRDMFKTITDENDLNYTNHSYYTGSFMLYDECKDIWQTSEVYEACDQAAIAIKDENKVFQGIVRIGCEFNDEIGTSSCDDIVKSLVVTKGDL